jgi:hypothetical protein
VLALLSVVVAPVHTLFIPVIAAGSGFTVTTIELAQPVPSVYVIVDVPVVNAVATPDEFIVTTLVFDELHVPPLVLLLYVAVLLSHINVGPLTAAGRGFTVITLVVAQPLLKA